MTFKKHIIFSLILSAIIGQGVAYKSIYLFHIVAIIFFGYTCISTGIKKTLIELKRFLPLFALLAYAFASLLWREEVAKPEYIYLYGALSLFTAFVLSSMATQKAPKVALTALGIATMGSLIIGFGEVLALFRYPLSAYSNLNWIAGRSYIHNESTTFPTGFAWNPNDYATFLCAVFPIFYAIPKNKFVKWTLSTLIFGLIICSNSRTAMIVAAVELTLLLSIDLLKSKINTKLKYSLLVVFIALISITSILTVSLSERNITKFQILFSKVEVMVSPSKWGSLPIDSENSRLIWAYNLGEAISQKPLMGHGPNAASSAKFHPSFDRDVSPHAFLLELITNFGIPWFLALTSLYIGLLVKLYRKGLHQNFLISLSFLPICSFSMSSCIFAIPLFCIIGITHGWTLTDPDAV